MTLYFKVPSNEDVAINSSKNVISALESIISEYGNIGEIISDNGKLFTAKEYQSITIWIHVGNQ